MKLTEEQIKYIGGLDISFSKLDNRRAVVVFVVYRYSPYFCRSPGCKPIALYTDSMEVTLTVPYSKNNFTYREGPYYVIMIERLKQTKPELVPQLLLIDGPGQMVDGNVLSLATYVGMTVNICTIGIVKRFHPIGTFKFKSMKKIANLCKNIGSYRPIKNRDGDKLGVAMRVAHRRLYKDFIYVSPGYGMSIDESIKIIRRTYFHREIEPISVADKLGRKHIAAMDRSIKKRFSDCHEIDRMLNCSIYGITK